ncbi:MAG TPA: glycosyltransferase [Williamwhitmania sp.]|nr:glycosyltransferase [Williamwhitmania sp.]
MNPTKVFVCPLSWGLGHATRCIPIVEALLAQKVEVIIGGNGASGQLLQTRFPELLFIKIPFHEVMLHRHLPAWLSIVAQLPMLIGDLFKERRVAKQMVSEYGVRIIISDNRYMLRSSKAISVLITHQLRIMLPLMLTPLEPILALLIRALVSPFSQVWVPDFSDEQNLSGALSHGWLCRKKGVVYVGPLSRFRLPLPLIPKVGGKVVAIISGPDPRRSLIQKEIIEQAAAESITLTTICGTPTENVIERKGTTTLYPHLSDDALAKELASAEVVIANAGYSTVMDLWALDCHALLLPFPGQTEQCYLAKYLATKGTHLSIITTNLNLTEEIKRFSEFQFTKKESHRGVDLHLAICNLLKDEKYANHAG